MKLHYLAKKIIIAKHLIIKILFTNRERIGDNFLSKRAQTIAHVWRWIRA
jgi:hypothetical protein